MPRNEPATSNQELASRSGAIRDAKNPVVVIGRVAAAVVIGRGKVQRAVGSHRDFSNAPEVGEKLFFTHDFAAVVRIEHQSVEMLAAQATKVEVPAPERAACRCVRG